MKNQEGIGEETYRLEFNEKQQAYHLDNYTHEEETNGWFTIFEHCTDFEFKVFEALVDSVPQKKLTKKYLLLCASQSKAFLSNLVEHDLIINYKE